MSLRDKQKEWMQNHLRHMDGLLIPLGFKKLNRSEWIRKNGWKSDQVEFARNKHDPMRFVIIYRVFVPPYHTDVDFWDLAHEHPCYLLGDTNCRYIGIPRLSFQKKRLDKKLIEQLEQTLPWFEEQLGTPQKCIGYLEQSPLKKDSVAYQAMAEYLQLVISGEYRSYLEHLERNCSSNTKQYFFRRQ